MVERFGNVCYWAGCIGTLAGLIWGFNIYEPEKGADPTENFIVNIFMALVVGFPIWLSGLAVRYILTGRGLNNPES